MPKKLEQPTAEMVIEAGRDLDDCPEVKRAFTKLWPGVFKPEPVKMNGGDFYDEDGKIVAWLAMDKKTILLTNKFDWTIFEADENYSYPRAIPTRK